jgi:sensor histidine kinase YesM
MGPAVLDKLLHLKIRSVGSALHTNPELLAYGYSLVISVLLMKLSHSIIISTLLTFIRVRGDRMMTALHLGMFTSCLGKRC